MNVKDKIDNYRCGMVAIVGRPNVGKSTLLNSIIGEKIAIVSVVPQTTRNQIRGIYNDEKGQIVFIDTPGLHFGRDKLDQMMNQTSKGAIDGVDCIVYLVDTTRRIAEEERSVAEHVKSAKVPVILGLNKVDLKSANVDSYIKFWEEIKGQSVNEMKSFSLIALSGREGINIDKLIDVIFHYLPRGPALYPPDTVNDTPQKLVVSDIIREKFFDIMKEEIPHSLGILIEEMRPIKGKTLLIKALVYVERDTQKEIVIGKKGNILKRVGSLAREELEHVLDTKIFLELYVKTHKRWRDDISFLKEIGFSNDSL